MQYQITLSPERYQAIITLAAQQGRTLEELLDSWIIEHQERAQEQAFYGDDWIEESHRVFAETQAGKSVFYGSTEAFFQVIDEAPYAQESKAED